MGRLKASEMLRLHSTIAADTMVFIYYLQDISPYGGLLQPFFEAWESGTHHGVTSVITLLEILVQPLRAGRPEVAIDYREALADLPHLELVPVDGRLAERAARMRASHGLSVPDAIQIATALEAQATVFLTNDRCLRKIRGIEVALLDEMR